jgi:hypothetical protein
MRNKVIKNNTIWEVAVLVLLMVLIREVHRLDGLGWLEIYRKFHENCFEHSGNIKVLPPQSERQQC